MSFNSEVLQKLCVKGGLAARLSAEDQIGQTPQEMYSTFRIVLHNEIVSAISDFNGDFVNLENMPGPTGLLQMELMLGIPDCKRMCDLIHRKALPSKGDGRLRTTNIGYEITTKRPWVSFEVAVQRKRDMMGREASSIIILVAEIGPTGELYPEAEWDKLFLSVKKTPDGTNPDGIEIATEKDQIRGMLMRCDAILAETITVEEEKHYLEGIHAQKEEEIPNPFDIPDLDYDDEDYFDPYEKFENKDIDEMIQWHKKNKSIRPLVPIDGYIKCDRSDLEPEEITFQFPLFNEPLVTKDVYRKFLARGPVAPGKCQLGKTDRGQFLGAVETFEEIIRILNSVEGDFEMYKRMTSTKNKLMFGLGTKPKVINGEIGSVKGEPRKDRGRCENIPELHELLNKWTQKYDFEVTPSEKRLHQDNYILEITTSLYEYFGSKRSFSLYKAIENAVSLMLQCSTLQQKKGEKKREVFLIPIMSVGGVAGDMPETTKGNRMESDVPEVKETFVMEKDAILYGYLMVPHGETKIKDSGSALKMFVIAICDGDEPQMKLWNSMDVWMSKEGSGLSKITKNTNPDLLVRKVLKTRSTMMPPAKAEHLVNVSKSIVSTIHHAATAVRELELKYDARVVVERLLEVESLKKYFDQLNSWMFMATIFADRSSEGIGAVVSHFAKIPWARERGRTMKVRNREELIDKIGGPNAERVQGWYALFVLDCANIPFIQDNVGGNWDDEDHSDDESL